MLKITLITIQLFLLHSAISVFAQESQKPTVTNLIDISSGSVRSSEGEFATIESTRAEVSERMIKKMREMEKIAAEVEGQDDAALEVLGGKLGKTLAALPLTKDLLFAIKDKRFEWRVRYLAMVYKSPMGGDFAANKYSDAFIEIMRDRSEHERIRAAAALILMDASKTNIKVKEAIAEVAKSSDTQAELLKSVMAVAGYGGVDDTDALMRLTERNPADLNEVGINLNAIRALGKSKNSRAFGSLVKIFDESEPDSFYNYTALQQFWYFIKTSEGRGQVRPVLVPRLLKLLDDRSYLGPSRREAAALLAELHTDEAVGPILRWFLPANETHAVVGGGGNSMDVYFGADALVKLGDKRAISVLEQTLNNFSNDSRWAWGKPEMLRRGLKFPDDHQDYKHLQKCLADLKKQK